MCYCVVGAMPTSRQAVFATRAMTDCVHARGVHVRQPPGCVLLARRVVGRLCRPWRVNVVSWCCRWQIKQVCLPMSRSVLSLDMYSIPWSLFPSECLRSQNCLPATYLTFPGDRKFLRSRVGGPPRHDSNAYQREDTFTGPVALAVHTSFFSAPQPHMQRLGRDRVRTIMHGESRSSGTVAGLACRLLV